MESSGAREAPPRCLWRKNPEGGEAGTFSLQMTGHHPLREERGLPARCPRLVGVGHDGDFRGAAREALPAVSVTRARGLGERENIPRWIHSFAEDELT